MTDFVEAFREGAARSDRMFWLDGGGARPWSGRRSMIGVLDEDDVSLTYDAGSRVVLRHQAGTAEPIGDDVFAALETEVAKDAGDPQVSWVGYFGYASRSDLPARAAVGTPDAVWMRVRDPLVVEHDPVESAAAQVPPPSELEVPAA
ncbi:MAG TPA: hypothetical protein VLI04_19780, partial [Nocardioidaceae bacterium]|nr:hypothetical protein [Nocardioidaceae bacterium]